MSSGGSRPLSFFKERQANDSYQPDLHSIFPNPKVDADDPANYYFTQTDDYLKATRAAGADIYFRLGETIEQQLHKKYVCPEWWPSSRQIGRGFHA